MSRFLGYDADGNTVNFGDRVRVRLSRLLANGISREYRHGVMLTEKKMWSSATGGAGPLWVSVGDVRLDPPDYDEQKEVPFQMTDADGTDVHIGDPVRIRLSRLDCYGLTESKRYGYISDIIGDRAEVTLPSKLVVPSDDFRAS